MKTVAILLDGGFVLARLYQLLGRRHAIAQDVYDFALACANEDEEIFRIYYYDCPPWGETLSNPLDPTRKINFASTATARRMKRLQEGLALMDLVAFRRGELAYGGWALKKKAERDFFNNPNEPRSIDKTDLQVQFRQKRVDMKIGLDVAWLASKRVVERIILVTGDSDFIPAMKFARREGTQVILVPMGHKYIKNDLREHSDFVRDVRFPPALFHKNE